MKPKIVIGCDIAQTGTDHTAICVAKKNRNRGIRILELFRANVSDSDYQQKLHAFYLKWHPNFFRRWLFRLLGI